MHFGRVASDKDLKLSLPEDGVRTSSFLALDWKGRKLFYCGAPIWACKDWIGVVYPETIKPTQYLRYYAQRYAMIELTSSFYHLPSLEQVRLWLYETGPEFRFLPKMPKALSHNLKSPTNTSLLGQYREVVDAFGDKLGTSFMQLPEWFELKDFPALEAFLLQLPKDFPLAIEFRHPSWFDKGNLIDPLVNFLYRRGLATVITDTPGERAVLHTSLSAPRVLVRFQGCFPSKQDDQRLKDWIDRLAFWLSQGLDTAYLAIHQPRDGAIPASVDFALRYLYSKSEVQAVFASHRDDD